MCLFIESIKISDGKAQNLHYHQERMAETICSFFGNKAIVPSLENVIKLTDHCNNRLIKCRIIYNQKIQDISFHPYQILKTETLKLVDGGQIDYSHKSADRTAIVSLLKQRGSQDDILIIKNGHISDSSYSNILFFDGKRWLTPDSPLLKGTKRRQLLHDGIVTEHRITPEDLKNYSHFMLVNAMLDFDLNRKIPITGIRF